MPELFGNPDEQTSTQEGTPNVEAGGDQSNQSTPKTEDYANQLGLIVAEDGRQKYADVATALQSIPHAQAEIGRLKQELEDAQTLVKEAKGIDDVLAQLTSKPSEQTQ